MTKQKNLILVGGGGHCTSVLDVAEQAGYSIVGILDVASRVGDRVCNYPIIASDEAIADYVSDAEFIVSVGSIADTAMRVALVKKIEQAGGSFATIISPRAYVSPYAVVKPGTVVMHHAIINACAQVSANCIINTAAIVEHDASIGEFCHISTAAVINGGCSIGSHCFVGSNAVVAHMCSIVDNTVIGAGTVVVKSIDVPGTYCMNPAVKKSRK